MKRFLCIFFSFLLILSNLAVSVFADETVITDTSAETEAEIAIDTEKENTDDNILKLNINGKMIEYSTYGDILFESITLEKTFIPFDVFTSAVEAKAEFNEKSGKYTVDFFGYTYDFKIGSGTFKRAPHDSNKPQVYSIEVPLKYENGTVWVSTDVLSVAFGARVMMTKDALAISVEVPEKDLAPKKLGVDNSKKGGFIEEFFTVVGAMNIGFLSTLKLFAVTLLGALPLGLLICLCSISKIKPIKWVTRFLVWVIRGTPLMLQLIIIYYIPGIAQGGNSFWPSGEEGRFLAASIAFIINYAFYFSEIFRGGIESIPNGQIEAGQVLGMTKTQIFFHVTLLQMVKRVVPPLSNEIITLVKDTSIARIISLQEVIWAGYAFLKSSHGYSGLLWPLFFTGVYYLLFNGILTLLFGYIEKKLSYFKS